MLRIIISELVLFPAAVLCLLPVKNRLRFSTRAVLLAALLILIAETALLTLMEAKFGISNNELIPVAFMIMFAAYHLSLNVPLSKSLSVFFAVVAMFSLLSNISDCVCMLLQIPSDSTAFVLVGLGITVLFTALLYFPFSIYGSYIVDKTEPSTAWYITVLPSVCIFVINMAILPVSRYVYSYKGLIMHVLISLIALMFMYLLLYFVFYFIIRSALEKTRIETENRMLEMRQSQFDQQQRYYREEARKRHDFRQSLHTMRELCDAGEYGALGDYLREFEGSMPKKEIVDYTDNISLNALLNYYRHVSAQRDIRFSAKVGLPGKTDISDVDLCTMVGNILENAVAACGKTDEKQIDVIILAENDSQLFIIVTNSFDGRTRRQNGEYLSTSHEGKGYGLASIESIVEAHGGVAQFKHEGHTFYTNIAIPLNAG